MTENLTNLERHMITPILVSGLKKLSAERPKITIKEVQERLLNLGAHLTYDRLRIVLKDIQRRKLMNHIFLDKKIIYIANNENELQEYLTELKLLHVQVQRELAL